MTYVWGDPPAPWPQNDVEAGARVHGAAAAADLVPPIRALVEEAERVPVEADLGAYGARIEEMFEAGHPELTGAARRALAAKLTFESR